MPRSTLLFNLGLEGIQMGSGAGGEGEWATVLSKRSRGSLGGQGRATWDSGRGLSPHSRPSSSLSPPLAAQADPPPKGPDLAWVLGPTAKAQPEHTLTVGWIAAARSSLLSSPRPPHLSLGPLRHTHRPRPGTRPGPRSGKRASWSGCGPCPGAPSAPPGEERRPVNR